MNRSLPLVLVALAWPLAVSTQGRSDSYSLWGSQGLLEMPTARSAPDGELALSLAGHDPHARAAITFQITPRLSGTFRYGQFRRYFADGEDIFDRSFDLQYRLIDEGEWMPEVAVGLRDFVGTGLYTSEYIVATKAIGDRVTATVGLGWGRLGTEGGFDNPLGVIDEGFETRPDNDFGQGGTIATDVLFRGDAALFGGLSYRATDRMTLKLEYSSDAYVYEETNGIFERESPLNFGVTWTPVQGIDLTLAYMYGTTLGFGGTVYFDPGRRPFGGGFEDAPPPVVPRDSLAAASWGGAVTSDAVAARLDAALEAEGLDMIGWRIEGDTAWVRYQNDRFRTEAQAAGRAARALTGVLPPEVETIVLQPAENGLPKSAITLSRTDLERLENQPGATAEMARRGDVSDAAGGPKLEPAPRDLDDRFGWSIGPYLGFYVFDGDDPVRTDFGIEATATYALAPNLILDGAVRTRLGGSVAEGAISPSPLPPVRRDLTVYRSTAETSIERLTLAWYGRPSTDLYARVTAGYLETQFGGVSGELLWKPVDSQLALGAELNYAVKRDFDMLFGFQDYDVWTGHVSAYYQFDNGFTGRIDVGRYLAGDTGATITLDREFATGWKIGAYATFTDVSFEDFGEGSFDKGIRITIPLDWATGRDDPRERQASLSSLSRDGGARLNVDGRLYDVVRDGHRTDLGRSFGRFWR